MATWAWRLIAIAAIVTMGAGMLQLMAFGGVIGEAAGSLLAPLFGVLPEVGASYGRYPGQIAGVLVGVAGMLGTMLYLDEKHKQHGATHPQEH